MIRNEEIFERLLELFGIISNPSMIDFFLKDCNNSKIVFEHLYEHCHFYYDAMLFRNLSRICNLD